MSRSRRKPYFTDQQSGGTLERKREANRAVRASGKKEVRGEAKADLADGKAYRRESNPYDIRDWSFHSPKDKKAYRK